MPIHSGVLAIALSQYQNKNVFILLCLMVKAAIYNGGLFF